MAPQIPPKPLSLTLKMDPGTKGPHLYQVGAVTLVQESIEMAKVMTSVASLLLEDGIQLNWTFLQLKFLTKEQTSGDKDLNCRMGSAFLIWLKIPLEVLSWLEDSKALKDVTMQLPIFFDFQMLVQMQGK